MGDDEFNPFYPGDTIISPPGIPPSIRLTIPCVKQNLMSMESINESVKDLENTLDINNIATEPASESPTLQSTFSSSKGLETDSSAVTSASVSPATELSDNLGRYRLPFVNSATELVPYQSISQCSKLTLESMDEISSFSSLDSSVPTLNLKSADNVDIVAWFKQYLRLRLNYLRKQQRYCDMTLTCSEKIIRAHSIVLCLTNTWFTRCKQVIESSENPLSKVNFNKMDIKMFIPDIEATLFETLVEFMYTGKFRTLKQMPLNKLRAINDAAFKLGITEINLFESEYTKEIISAKNFVQLWDYADHSNNWSLRNDIVNFIINRFESLWMSIELLTLSEERLKRILSSVSTKPHLQDVALRALLAWVKQDITLRRSSFPVLITYVRISNVSESYLRFLLHHDPYVQENERLHKMLGRSLRDKARNSPTELRSQYTSKYKRNSSSLCSALSGKRKWLSKSASMMRVSHGSCSPLARKVLSPSVTSPHDGIIALNLQKKQSSDKDIHIMKTSSIFSLQDGETDCKKQDNIYLVIVGKDTVTKEIILMVYSVKNDSWMDIEILGPCEEENQTIASWKNCFYFVGGEDEFGKQKMRSVYVYDLYEKVSHRLPDMHIPRSNPIVFFHNKSIFVAGGVGRYTDSLTQVESLDLTDENSVWKNMPPMRVKRGVRASSTYLNDYIYVVGGGSQRCECFHGPSKAWNELPPLPNDFNQTTPLVVMADDRILTFNHFRPNKIYFFDFEAHQWKPEILKGNPPEWIVSVTCHGTVVYVLEKSQKLFSLDVYKRRWVPGIKIMRSQYQPIHISTCPLLSSNQPSKQ